MRGQTKIKGRPGILNGLVVEGCLSKRSHNNLESIKRFSNPAQSIDPLFEIESRLRANSKKGGPFAQRKTGERPRCWRDACDRFYRFEVYQPSTEFVQTRRPGHSNPPLDVSRCRLVSLVAGHAARLMAIPTLR